MRKLHINEIVPQKGNFEEIYKSLCKKADSIIDHCNEEQTYNKSLAALIKLIVGDFDLIGIWEDTIKKKLNTDHLGDPIINLLYTHMLIIRLNDTAHKYLNNIITPPVHEQLQDMVDNNPKIFGNLKILA
jgi:hypothetical protein